MFPETGSHGLSECINFSAFVLGLYATTTERNNQPCFFELYGSDSTSTVNGLINRLGVQYRHGLSLFSSVEIKGGTNSVYKSTLVCWPATIRPLHRINVIY